MPVPSEVVDQKGLSLSSYFSDDVHLENERQVKCWNSANMPDYHAGSGTVASSSLETLIPAEQKSLKSIDHRDSFLFQDQKVELICNKQLVGVLRKSSHSTNLLKTVDCDVGTQSLRPSYLAQRNEFNVIGAQCESSLFSSSLSELFTKKVTLSSNNALYGHSVDTVASHNEEEEPLESLEELEAQTIGNLLPNDDDLLSGLTDGLDYVLQQNGGEDAEDLDFFSNVGGMDLGDEDLSMGLKNSEFYGVSHGQQVTSNGSIGGEHPLGEHPSRTLFVRNINSNVEDSELRALFEQYGDIHTLYTACKHRGFVMISYYDIRGARNAMKALQNKPLRRRKLDIHFSIPKENPSEKDINHGSFVVLNLDSKISNDELFQIFGAYGEVKEVKEVPHRSSHKIIEFYDIRAAEAAVRALNWGDVLGKQIKLEPNYPVGGRWSLAQQFHPEMEKEDLRSYLQQSSSPMNCAIGLSGLNSKVSNICSSVDNESLLGLHSALRLHSLETVSNNGISSSVPINLSSQMRAESIGNKSAFVDSGHSPSLLKFQAAPAFHPHSLPEYHDGLHGRVHFNTHGPMAGNISLQPPETMDNHQQLGISSNGNSIALSEAFGSGGKGNCSFPGHKYTWGNSYHPHPTGMVWPNSPSYVNGIRAGHPPSQLQEVPRAPAHMIPAVLPISNHHVGSAPSVNPSFWDRHNPYVVESPEFSGFLPGSLGSRKVSNDSHSIDFVSHIFAQAGGSCIDLPITERNVGLQPHHQRCMIFPGRNQILPSMISFDYPSERSRSRRNESFSSQVENKRQYELDIDRIRLGEDIRTTLMIKNIPNKYTSKMLLAAIDERHRGAYDFIYLPIDFKNKCNVGYAFINMTDPALIIPFHETFNGKKWEKFNSEKVASLAYARIQGKAALVAHFQNSSLMNEDKRCRPILFTTEGPNAGDQVPFPMGVNVRTRPGKARSNTCEESHSDSPFDSINGDDCFIEDAPFGSAKVSDPAPQGLDFCEH